MDNNYTQITWPEVRKGDVLMHENGDRLTVLSTERRYEDRSIGVTPASLDLTSFGWARRGWAPYRKVEPLPTVPGAYLDKDGDCWLLDRSGNWYDWTLLDEPTFKGGNPQNYTPFTRLVPMPTEENVNSSIFKGFWGAQVSGVYIERATDAVMALLGGDDA